MTADAAEVTRRVEGLSRSLRDAGLRLTHQRLEIVRQIAADETHPDVETVYRAVRERVPTIALDTVYRTLAMLTGQGLINRVTLTPGAARFDPNATPHHHFVCAHCRLIRDVQSTELDAIQPPTDVLGIGLPDAVTVQFTGICSACQSKDTTGGGPSRLPERRPGPRLRKWPVDSQ